MFLYDITFSSNFFQYILLIIYIYYILPHFEASLFYDLFYIYLLYSIIRGTGNVWNNIEDLREEKQITQSQLGEFLHLNQRTISNYENGIRFPSEDILISIADYFEVSLDYLFGRTKIKNIYNDKNDTY